MANYETINSNYEDRPVIHSSSIEDNIIKDIYVDDRGNLHIMNNHNCSHIVAAGYITDNLENKLKEIEEKYENQLQRQKVHISRGGRITGHRVHGRNRKVAISKRCFRNSKGIKSVPTAT